MIKANGVYGSQPAFGGKVEKQQKGESVAKAKGKSASSSGEVKLSVKAQKFIESLRKKHGDFDFIVADKTDDVKSLVGQSDKEFSVVFSKEEIEKMARDEDYAFQKLHAVDTAVEMSLRINEQFGFERAWDLKSEEAGILNKISYSFDDNGLMKIFAEIEKASPNNSEGNPFLIRKATVEAASEEDLFTKIAGIDWSKLPDELKETGNKVNFSV